jgi:hypothetical protein
MEGMFAGDVGGSREFQVRPCNACKGRHAVMFTTLRLFFLDIKCYLCPDNRQQNPNKKSINSL